MKDGRKGKKEERLYRQERCRKGKGFRKERGDAKEKSRRKRRNATVSLLEREKSAFFSFCLAEGGKEGKGVIDEKKGKGAAPFKRGEHLSSLKLEMGERGKKKKTFGAELTIRNDSQGEEKEGTQLSAIEKKEGKDAQKEKESGKKPLRY